MARANCYLMWPLTTEQGEPMGGWEKEDEGEKGIGWRGRETEERDEKDGEEELDEVKEDKDKANENAEDEVDEVEPARAAEPIQSSQGIRRQLHKVENWAASKVKGLHLVW